jgi:cell division protein FtsL
MTPTAHKRRWRNVPVVREPDRARTRQLLVVLMWMAATVAPFTLYLVQQMEYVRVRYEIEELRVNHDRLLEAEQRLRIERARLTSPARVERHAVTRLGLVNPPPSRVVVLSRIAPGTEGLMARAPDQQ